ncbi:bone morphogenetic protein 2-like [Scyliorhinus canicula]|uniref:bone morphogenetic protein 2-like n=1 Tax=Scyliorhinus canicula TaxID=7830 RepID=UPI0018F63505|nr:bone morphogenetic protein 2-like [Scyliorhinus canicula]XP_038646928.1 bone morphogenetic protein 2-like [Scyliorhinus canicula]
MELGSYYSLFASIYLTLTCIRSSEPKPQSSLRWRDEKQIRMEAIKETVVQQLGLGGPPVSGLNNSGSEEEKMYKLYLQRVRQFDQSISSTNKNVVRISSVNMFIQKGTVLESTSRTNDLTSSKQRFYFNVSIAKNRLVSPKVKILRGELKIYKRLQQNASLHQKQRTGNLLLVKIYQLLKPAIEGKELKLHFLGSKVIASHYETAEMFDIRKTVEYWITYPQENYGLELELLAWLSSHKYDPEDKVTIEAELEIEMHKIFKEVRTRRESHTEDCQRNQIQCCRRSLHVSFAEIGWSDWIRAPLSYNAFYCDGTCPQKYKLATMHTLIKSKMNHLSNGVIPAPCCVPAAYEPLTLLHFNSNSKLTLTAFDDMVVSRCHCS